MRSGQALGGACAEHGCAPEELDGVGVGLPCFLRRPEGRVLKSVNLPELEGVCAPELLRAALGGVRVEVDNDCHAAALAESRRGAGRGCPDMLYCAVSTGIASAPILGGKLFRGSYGFSGESGHMLITPGEGLRCSCGKRGCFESWCGGRMIARHAALWISRGERSVLADLPGGPESITAADIAEAWRRGDALAERAIRQMQRYLTLWLYNLDTYNLASSLWAAG